MSAILLADGREIPIHQLPSMCVLENIFTAFRCGDGLILDRITPSNVLKIEPVLYRFDENGRPLYSIGDREIPCETLADEYNSRTGKYARMFQYGCSPEDLPVGIVHLNGSVRDCSPSNITRRYDAQKARIGIDYYRSVSHSPSLATIATQMYPLVKMKEQFCKYIDREFYDAHSHDYSDMPVAWNWLAEKFGSTESINRHADNAIRENALHKPKPQDKEMSVYVISDTATNEGRRMTAFMESFLEDRGYRVFSPSRDIVRSVLNPMTEEQENGKKIMEISRCDLAVACISPGLGCFAGDTVIKLAGGESIQIKDMKRRRAGYRVISYSVKTKRFSEGFTYGSVLVEKSAPVSMVEFTTGEKVYCTPDHPFLMTDGRYIVAEKLKPGMKIVSVYGSFVAEIASYAPDIRCEDIYGFEVMTDDKNYAIGAGGAIVSNSQIEIGIKIGIWHEDREQAVSRCSESLDSLSESDLALLNQKKPRLVAFSDCDANMSSLESRCLRCCSSWEELSAFFDETEQTGIRYVR